MAVPKLRFGEFDGDWTRYKIAEATEYLADGTHFSPKTKEGEFKYITSKNIRNNGLDLTNISYISKDEHEKIYKRCKVQLGDILLTKDGANTGNCCLNTLDEEFSLLSSVAVLRGKKDSFNNNFILQILQSELGQNTIISSMSGQAITRITLAKLKDYSFFFPELTEQTKIASFLSNVDEKINQLTQKHALLRQFKQGMMQKLFSQQIRFKADDGADFGEWEGKKLFELAINETLNNGVFNDQNKVGKGYKLINVLDMYIDRDIDESRLNLLDLDTKEFERNKVIYGDIFFTRSSLVKDGIAFSNVYLGYSPDITYDGHLIKLSPNLSKINPKFLNYSLKTSKVRKQLIRGGKTATMTTIGQHEIGNTKVDIPCLEEQTKIANFLSSIDQKIDVVAQQIEQAKVWKKGLLQQMFV